MEKTRSRTALLWVTHFRMKLLRFSYSPYARKVQILLDLLRAKYELVDVPYSDRSELARLTGGYIHVPVMLWDDGSVTLESRPICQQLLAQTPGHELVPSPLQGPIWAYADFCDGPLEDVLFRIASPGLHHAWQDPGDRALFALIKERKFGAGCVDAWQRDQAALIPR
jgi:glutathione S-transferase